MSPPVAQMAISAMKIVMGENGTNEGIVLYYVSPSVTYEDFNF